MVYYCCVPGCKNTNKESQTHTFPKEPVLHKLWLNKIGRNDLQEKSIERVRKSYRVCHIHFGPESLFIGSRRTSLIKTDAIPTLFLPNKTNGSSTLEMATEPVLPDSSSKNTENQGVLASTSEIIQPSTSFVKSFPHPTVSSKGTPGNTSKEKFPASTPAKISRSNTLEMETDQGTILAWTPEIIQPSTSFVESLPHATVSPKGTPRRTPKEKCPVSTPAKISNLRKRVSLLSYTNSRRASTLTPKKKKLYRIASDLRRTARKLDYQCSDLREQIKKYEDFSSCHEFLRAKLNQKTYQFVLSQLRCQPLHPKGRRYTLEEKILFLSLLKQSPKGYKLLRKLFALPSRKTLTNLLAKIPFHTGLNNHIMETMKLTVEKMKDIEKYCSIIFDEMAIEPLLQYNRKTDVIDGFQDNGGEESRKPLIADKAMVFMVRGLCKKWKQPMCYYFNEGGMKTDMLAKTIKEIVIACQNAGLKVKTLVCDQGSANVAAINKLYEETREHFIRKGEENRLFGVVIGGEEIIPLYDAPHLLKGIRNNFFKYNVVFKWRKEKVETACWDHIKQLFDFEATEDDDYKLCSKLTYHHVHNTKKMKVSVAAQIFSTRVASVMKRMAICNISDSAGSIPKEAESTAEFILFMDKVFDSVNGSSIMTKHGKELKTAVTERSKHLVFWSEAIKVFESMKFFNDKKNSVIPPSLKNWIHTLKGYSYIWNQLRKEGLTFLCTRNLNQDPLENFFGSIRSHGVRNVNPNASSFVNSFKTLIINNFISSHSASFNCEDDELEGLDNFKILLLSATNKPTKPSLSFPNVDVPEKDVGRCSLLRRGKLTYIAGFVAKQISKRIDVCEVCRNNLVEGDRSQEEYFLIEARAYSPRALLAPSTHFNLFFQKCMYLVATILPQICSSVNVTAILLLFLNHLCKDDGSIFKCKKHDVLKMLFHYMTKFHTYIWIRNINNIMKGKRTVHSSDDKIKMYALEKYKKHQQYKKRVASMKNLT